MAVSKVELSIIVPSHNEEENLRGLLKDLEQVLSAIPSPSEVVVVSDHSNDKTFSLAKKLARVYPWLLAVENDRPAGMGNAIKKGVQVSVGDYFAIVMADRVCDIMSLPSMLKMARMRDLDIVIGSRYMERRAVAFRATFRYHVSSILFRLVSKPLFPHITDPTYAFRVIRRSFWDSFPPRAGDFSISPENTLLGVFRHARIGEYPTLHGVRRRGHSSFKFGKMGIAYTRLIIWGLVNWRRFRMNQWQCGHSPRFDVSLDLAK